MSKTLHTPLTAWHKAAGAKMAPFAGWEMPIQYTGIIAEHTHCREQASIYDICHMGEFALVGAGSRDALSKIVTHNLEKLAPGKCGYGFLLNKEGGILDDLIVYCLEEDEYMLVVNAACIKSDFNWIKERLPEYVTLEDMSDQTAKIDLQGPKSYDVLEKIFDSSLRDLKYFNFRTVEFKGQPVIISRTGYTGELGYEFYLPSENAKALWEALMAQEEVEPAGLGARDTLRLEVGLPLYGQDLDTTHSPTAAGMGWMLRSEAEYVGKGKDREGTELLIALSIPGRRSARHDDVVTLEDGTEVGHVTSGSYCPSVGHSVALAYVKIEAADNEKFLVKGARTSLEATKAELPFYKDGTARMKLVD
ncbi:glycine cleavage system aminomethyltransferase GcvT [Halodesulfovibrio sp. MK-HDV]|uniref:glycine cleavage system aminomethyltransferase GcvT n=1 Tax=Halodesulfovibrio sp. MK-HDV TaxID=2599925 RepID=UPI00136B6D42|nr:glycine cleavage system aminomethyltransferase GcvT [Halodesulfovibrio sp. MK-HDV]KAF1077701.1 Aminomethyltransferase [Halodesulfovibrio sp. MK-HDV]